MLGAVLTASLAACGGESGESPDSFEQLAVSDHVVYGDSLGAGWMDWSWASRNLANRSPVRSGKRSIAVTFGAWQALYFRHAGVPAGSFTHLQFYANGGATAEPALVAKTVVGDVEQAPIAVASYCTNGKIPANGWSLCKIPLAALAATAGSIQGVILQEGAGRSLPKMYFDDIRVVAAAAPVLPAAPTGLRATVSGSQVSLAWTATAGATAYHVYRAESAAGPFARRTSSPQGATTFVDSGLTAGRTYHYAVSAVNSAGEGPRSASVAATIASAPAPQPDPALTLVYGDALASPWTDGSWNAHNLAASSPVATGTRSISASFGAWEGLYFVHPGFSTTPFTSLVLRVHGGTAGGGAALRVRTIANDVWSAGTDLGPRCAAGAVVANAWTECTVPLSAIAAPGQTITGIAIQEWRGGSIPTIYVDEIGFAPSGTGGTDPGTGGTGGSDPGTGGTGGTGGTDPGTGGTGGTDPGSGGTGGSDPGTGGTGGTTPPPAGSTDTTGLIPADRVTVWKPGLNAVGGIPNRTTVCRTLSPSGGDDTSAIQSALNACPADQVVKLSAGNFRLSGGGLSINRSDVTLRGSGPGSTRLIKTVGSGSAAITVGRSWFNYTAHTNLTANGVKGSTSVTLASNPGLQVGEIVVVTQLADPKISRWSDRSPPGDPSRGWSGRYDRPLGQTLEVASISGNTVTFTTPLHITFSTAYQAQLSRLSTYENGPVWSPPRRVGIEDLYVYGGEGHDGGGNVHLWAAPFSWVKNIESEGSLGSSVALDGTFRSVLRDSYVHSTRDPNPGGNGYGIGLARYASDNLVENNISWNFNKVILMRTTGGGNVIGYNYMEDAWGAGYPTIPETGLNASHMTTPHQELFEGNQAFAFGGDNVWGNSVYITVFRNHFTGKRRSVAPLNLDDVSVRKVAEVPGTHWWYSFVGNVLGTLGQSPAPNRSFVYEATPPWPSDPVPMWMIGQLGSGSDAATITSTLRHGNYDYLTGRTAWDASLSRRDLPASLYLTSKPAFFGSSPWPWVTPENPAAPTATLPARARFDALHGSN